MNGNARLKRIAATLLALILVLQVSPFNAESQPADQPVVYSDWWRPHVELAAAEYTFSGIGDTVLLPYLLGLHGVFGIITDASLDSDAVKLSDDLYLTAVDSFETVTLKVHTSAGNYTILLHNPAAAEPGTLTAEEDHYSVDLRFSPEAGLPEDASVEAVEIDPGAENYETNAARVAESLGWGRESIGYIRMLDIAIQDEKGEKCQPAAPVEVTLTLDDLPEDKAASLRVVHLAEDGTAAVVEPVHVSGQSVTFMADSFSVYSVAAQGQTTDLDGKTFAIINSNTKNAVLGEKQGDSKLRKIALTFSTVNGKPRITADEEITAWTFEHVEGDTYRIRADSGSYLVLQDNVVTLTENESDASAITVTAGTGNRAGMVRFTVYDKNGVRAINDYDNGKIASGIGEWADNGNNEWFTLTEISEIALHPAYEGTKLGVQDVQDAQQVILYKSVYVEAEDKYVDYVIDGYGNLVRGYDNGDRVSLRSETSPVWTVTIHRDEITNEPNGYYDFYNEATGLYLSPQSDGSLVSAERPGLLLNGRRNGEYNSTIERWDNATMSYYGYRVAQEEDGQPIDPVLRSTGHASSETFSFAAYRSTVTEQLHTVATVDSKAAGITIRMFDYPGRSTITNITGSDSYAEGQLPKTHVGMTLGENGYPTFANGNNGAALFSPGSGYYKGEGNNLFLASTYAATGYYEYSSFNNFASYSGGSFTVYQELGTPSNDNKFYFQRGNFLPFNSLDVTRKATNTNKYDESGTSLPYEDPNNGKTLYLTQGTDFYFGMTAEATFMQPRDGLDHGNPVLYEFNGDDDLWIYIDGVLVLDIGGVHDAWRGSINFATGRISGGNGGAGGAATLRDAFKNAGVFPDGTAWDDARADAYFSGDTFADYSSHDFKMFYMEHGAGASNLEMRFNLPVYEKGTFVVEKALDDEVQVYGNPSFPFQAFAKISENNYKPLTDAVYEKTGEPVPFTTVTINGTTYENVFYMKPDQPIKFTEDADAQEYFVQELDAGSDEYSEIRINGVKIDGRDVQPEDGVYRSSDASAITRARTEFVNITAETNRNELRITKQATPDSVNDGATFEFRVLLEDADGKLTPYSVGDYYIQDAEGNYYHYVNGQLTSNGADPIVGSTSGMNGTIAGIPIGYTVSIRGLISGTDFYVEEIRNPEGWQLYSKTLEEGTYAASELTGVSWNNLPIKADGQIILRKDAHVIFTNDSRLHVQIPGVKQITGRDMQKDDVFTFILTSLDADHPGMEANSLSVHNDPEDGSFAFDLVYSKGNCPAQNGETKTYWYTVTEENGGQLLNGLYYSDATFWVEVTLTNHDGVIEATKHYYTADPRQPQTVMA